MNEPFVTSRMAPWLDLVRVLAAFAVLVGHAVQLGLYTGYFPFSIALQQNAVIVFFVLSGLLVAHSAERARLLRFYVIARVSRILPVTLGAVAISLAVSTLDASFHTPLQFAEDASWNDPASSIGALLFLGESYLPDFALNPPYWSLCYEVWFYAMFGAATFLKGRAQIAWLAFLGLAAGPNVLLLLPCWLLGVVLQRRAVSLPMRWSRPAIALALASLPAVPHIAGPGLTLLMKIAPWDLGHSLYALSYLVLAACVATGLMGLRTLSDHGWTVPARCQAGVRYFAEMSFSLYLLHWPLLKLLRLAGWSAGSNLAGFAFILIAVVGLSGAFAALTERKRPALRIWLELKFAPCVPLPAA